MINIYEYLSKDKISLINEYFSQSEKISLIKEYLLSKNKKTMPEDYFIVWPSFEVYRKFIELYEDKMIRAKVDYWVLSKSELLNGIQDISKGYLEENIYVFEIPDEYDKNAVKDAILNKEINPYHDFKPININTLL